MTTEPPVPGPSGLPPASGRGKTEEEMWRWVLRRLGGGIVDIELTSRGDIDPLTDTPFPAGENHQDDCLDDARRWYSHRVGFKKVIQIALGNGQGAYMLAPDIIDVISVYLPSFQLPTLDADQFSYTYFSMLFGQWTNPGVAPLPYSDLVQRLQYLEEIGRIFSSDRDWIWTKETRTLEILPPPSAAGALYGSTADVTALITTWTRNIDTRQLDPMEEDFFQRKLLAEAYKRLGSIRSTLTSWPAIGGEKDMSGDLWYDRASEIEDSLKEDILNWKRPVGIIFG
jgi:hypothetical protein